MRRKTQGARKFRRGIRELWRIAAYWRSSWCARPGAPLHFRRAPSPTIIVGILERGGCVGTGNGSLETFDEVALPCLPELARFARSLAHDASDADDLVQETYLRAFEAWQSFQLGTDCRRWLFTICRNVFLRTRERSQRVVSVEDPEAEALGAVMTHKQARDAGLDDLYARIDLGPALDRAIDMLSDPFATVVRLIDVDGRTY